MSELTVVTWNMQYTDPAKLRLDALLRDVQPDIVLLQEALGAQVTAALPAEYVSRRYWQWDHSANLGVMIASRLPLEAAGTLGSKEPPWDQERVCWLRLRADSGPLTAVAVHLTSPTRPRWLAQRNAQRADLAARLERFLADGERLVVGGDFNTINPVLPGLVDACGDSARPTWRTAYAMWLPPLLRLDAIFASPDIGVLAGHADDRWRASDHLPVVARLAL